MSDTRRVVAHDSASTSPLVAAPVIGKIPPIFLVVLSITSTQIGAALAHHLFGILGPAGTVLLRLGFAAIILVLTPGGLPSRAPRAAYIPAFLFGLTLACMNFSFYYALARIPLGIAVTIELSGPLLIAVLGSRRIIDFVWILLAGSGIFLFAPWTGATLDPLGVLLALVAGGFWACYILLSARVGQLFPGRSGLALAMCVGAALMVPVGVLSAGPSLLNPLVLVAGCGVALLSSALPYSLEIEALRRLPTHVFGIMMSLEPAVAALAGFLLLSEHLDGRDIIALVLVTVATLGVTWQQRRAKAIV